LLVDRDLIVPKSVELDEFPGMRLELLGALAAARACGAKRAPERSRFVDGHEA